MNPQRIMRIAENLAEDENSLTGMKKVKARREVNKVIHLNTPKGLLRDTDWRWVQQIWRALDSASLDWVMTDSFYTKNRDGIPESKTWKFEVYFNNDKGRRSVLYGVLIASGAGTVRDPLDRYDIVAYVS